MRPDRWRIIVGATAWVQTKAPRRLTEMTASKSASLIPPWISPSLTFTSWASRRIPALFTSTSMRPWVFAMSAAAFATATGSVTSTRTSAPSATSQVTTIAPASRNTRAVSAPIPRAPPVITATFPSSRNITSHPRVFGLFLPAFARLELVHVTLGLEIEALDHRDEPVALLRWCRPDPATDDVVDAHARRAALARNDLALVMRGRPRELADRLGHHAADGREHALRRVIPLHQAIASIPVAKRPTISFWICVVPS